MSDKKWNVKEVRVQGQAIVGDDNQMIVNINNTKKLEKKIDSMQTEMGEDAPAVFLSYAREDLKEVHRLYLHLKEQGMRPWLDKEDLMVGVEWDRATRKAIQQADFIVICLSSRTNKRGYIQREIKLALNCYEEIPPGKVFLLPVRFEKCEVPEALLEYQYTDLFRKDGLERLVNSIKNHWASRNKDR